VPAQIDQVPVGARAGLGRGERVSRRGGHHSGDCAASVAPFGDGWQHDIVVESEVSSTGTALKAECPGARACPPEDCGGAHGYADLLEALADPSNDRHAELKDWVGPHFVSEEFDLASLNLRASWRRLCSLASQAGTVLRLMMNSAVRVIDAVG
jgi:hypothetical protein